MNTMKAPQESRKLKNQLVRLLDEKTLSLGLISALAGDRELTQKEKDLVKKIKRKKGDEFYSDILFVLTHQHYSPLDSKRLWKSIVKHKSEVSKILGRNFGIAASALDYLSNISDRLEAPTLISEPQINTIAEVAMKDELTQLYDYSTFQSRLNTEVTRYKRYGTAFSLIMLDIDDFKKINDKYGHQKGDDILRSIASTMLKVTRGLDICVRYGGEEFAVILPQTVSGKAAVLAERLRKHVARKLKKNDVTISLGVATCPKNAKTAKTLVKKADDALYVSKSKGKNCVTVC